MLASIEAKWSRVSVWDFSSSRISPFSLLDAPGKEREASRLMIRTWSRYVGTQIATGPFSSLWETIGIDRGSKRAEDDNTGIVIAAANGIKIITLLAIWSTKVKNWIILVFKTMMTSWILMVRRYVLRKTFLTFPPPKTILARTDGDDDISWWNIIKW